MKRLVLRTVCLLAVLAAAEPAEARVVRVAVRTRADLLGGEAFGLAGPYEKLSGMMFFAVKPGDPRDDAIVDLALAPRNAEGLVEFSADFFVLKPKDPARGSGTLLLEVPNRGGKGILALMNRGRGALDPAAPEELGDGFLMRRGATVAWGGWPWGVRAGPRPPPPERPGPQEPRKTLTGPLRASF